MAKWFTAVWGVGVSAYAETIINDYARHYDDVEDDDFENMGVSNSLPVSTYAVAVNIDDDALAAEIAAAAAMDFSAADMELAVDADESVPTASPWVLLLFATLLIFAECTIKGRMQWRHRHSWKKFVHVSKQML